MDFSTQEAFEKAKSNEVADNAQVSTIPGTVEDWLREQDMKRERGELVSVSYHLIYCAVSKMHYYILPLLGINLLKAAVP